MKTKLMKKMIALICAAAMTTSCATASVGAFNAPEGASQSFVNKVNNLNSKLLACKSNMNNIANKIGGFCNEARNRGLSFGLAKRDAIWSVMDCFSIPVTYGSYLGKNECQDIELVEVEGNGTIDEISNMMGEFEKIISDFDKKVDGLSVDYEKDQVFYKEKSGIGKIFTFDKAQNLSNEYKEKIKDKISQMYNKAKDSNNKEKYKKLLDEMRGQLKQYDESCAVIECLKESFNIEGYLPLRARRYNELRTLVNNVYGDSLEITDGKRQELCADTAQLKKYMPRVKNANILLEDIIYKMIVKNKKEFKNKIRSTMDELINKLIDPNNLNFKEKFVSDPNFREDNKKFLEKVLASLKLWARSSHDKEKLNHYDNLQDQYTQIITLYTTDYSHLSQEEWVEKVKSQAEEVKKALNTLLDNMSKKSNQNQG